MDRRSFGEVCRVRSVSWGTMMIEYLYPHTVRTMARAGYDWLWIDNEHAHFSLERVQEAVRTAEDVGIATILRVADSVYSLMARGLDLGVDGLLLPRVETPDTVRRIVDAARFPPDGRRGFGIRPSVYGDWSISMKERIEDQNNNRFLFIQVESERGVENLEAMLEEADGQVDGVFFGAADYLLDIGQPDAFDSGELDEAAREVAELCEQFGIASGTLAFTVEDARRWLDRNYNLIAYGFDDAFMAQAAHAARRALTALE